MRGFRAYAVVLLVLPLVASLFGCGGSSEEVATTPSGSSANSTEMESPAPPPPPPPAPTSAEGPAPSGKAKAESTVFSTVLASWNKGDKDRAVEQLLSIRWDGPDVFANIPGMHISEKRFASLPHDEREHNMEVACELIGPLKNLARHAFATGENAQASGDKQAAKAHYEAVLHLGQALQNEEHLLIIQLTGKAMTNGARERLSAVK